jgi:hypothetical protein
MSFAMQEWVVINRIIPANSRRGTEFGFNSCVLRRPSVVESLIICNSTIQATRRSAGIESRHAHTNDISIMTDFMILDSHITVKNS